MRVADDAAANDGYRQRWVLPAMSDACNGATDDGAIEHGVADDSFTAPAMGPRTMCVGDDARW